MQNETLPAAPWPCYLPGLHHSHVVEWTAGHPLLCAGRPPTRALRPPEVATLHDALAAVAIPPAPVEQLVDRESRPTGKELAASYVLAAVLGFGGVVAAAASTGSLAVTIIVAAGVPVIVTLLAAAIRARRDQ